MSMAAIETFTKAILPRPFGHFFHLPTTPHSNLTIKVDDYG
jgi:hypothetical protein